jgi:hypothetical protein
MKKYILASLFALWSSLAQAGVSCSLPFNLQNNTIADATQVMANYNALVACLGNAAGAGANTDITSLLGLTTPLGPTFGGANTFYGGTSGGAANAQTITVVPSSFALTPGFKVSFAANFTNNSAMTLNVNGTGVINVLRQTPAGLVALIGGEVVAGTRPLFEYDGAQWELLTNSAQYGGFGALTSLASAATTDLGLVVSHNVNVTGNTTITSFGSSASTTYPYFRITFAGALVLTQNATSLILPGGVNLTTAANDTAIALYLGGGNWQIIDYQKATGFPITPTPVPGLIFGCNLSGGGSTTLTITACTTTSDDQTTTQAISTTYTKTFASFAVGTGNGALDTGSIATNTWYHVFEIERTDTGVVDYLFSLSATAPTFPTNYTKKRRLGSIKTDATPNILAFTQNGDFFYKAPTTDYNSTSALSATLTTFQVPPGVAVNPLLNLQFATSSGGASNSATVSFAPAANSAFSAVSCYFGNNGGSANLQGCGSVVGPTTNTSAQIFVTVALVSALSQGTISSSGWIDSRGKNP